MSDGGAPLLDAFLGGLEASISVLLTLGYGVLAGHLGLVSEQTTKDVSKLCNKFFLPALLVVNVGSQLSMSNLDKYWPVLCECSYVQWSRDPCLPLTLMFSR